jgi:hypothetical protein
VLHRARLAAPAVRHGGVTNDSVSTNWSGLADTGASFTSVGATWTVPTATEPVVSGTPRSGYSATWVGIGGDTDATLIQAGTEQDATSTGTEYYAWYELLPYYSIPINHPVSAGDAVTVTITETNKATQAWTIVVADATQHWTFTKPTTYSSSNASAEWIEEAPTIGANQSRMADFGTVTLSALQVNGVSQLAPAGASVDRIDYADASHTVRSYPEGYDAGSNSFAIQYGTPSALHVTSASLPDARQGAPYGATLTGAGGVSPYTWSLSGGPSWLSVDPATGALTGTPTAAGSVAFTAQVKDSHGTMASATVLLDVLTTTFVLTQATPPTTSATAGRGLHEQLTTNEPASLTGVVAFTTTSASPAFGVSSTGLVSVPKTTAPGTYVANGTDADAHGDQGTWTLTVKVLHPASVVIVTRSLPAGKVAAKYGVQLVAFGPAGTLRWKLVNGSRLPAGLALSAGGRLAGTPKKAAAGTHRLALEAAVGAKHASTTLTLSIAR